MARTNQGGSILSFIVLGSVMALLLIGGVFAIRRYMAPDQGGPRIAVNDKGVAPDQAPKTDKPSPADKNDKAEQTPKPQPVVIPGDTETKQNTDIRNPDIPANTSSPSPVQTGTSSVSDGLPSTGPSSALIGGIMLSCLVAFLAAYAQSRRLSSSL